MTRRKSKKNVVPLWFVVLIFIIAAVLYYFNYKKDNHIDESNPSLFENLPEGGNGVLNIYFLNVGHGDCSIIEFPDNKTMMIDSGDNISKAEDKILEFKQLLDIETLDYVLLTHSDADHVGSMDVVFDNFDVKKVFRPNVLSTHTDAISLKAGINVGFTNAQGGQVSSSKAYYTFLSKLQTEMQYSECSFDIVDKSCDFSGGYLVDGVKYEYVFDFLTPILDGENVKYDEANDYSPIIKLVYNGVTIIFTGDAENIVENEFLAHYANNIPNCDLLKVGHHGSNSSSQKAFVNAIDPEYAIIQSGGKYGHPHQVTLDTLNNAGAKVFRNDNNGDIAVSISYGDDYIFSAEHIYCTNNDLSKNLIGGDTESAE